MIVWKSSLDTVDINAEAYAIPTEVESPVQVHETVDKQTGRACINFEVERYDYLNDVFVVKHRLVHHDVSVCLLYGRAIIIKYTHTEFAEKHELFIPLYTNYPLADSYTVQWLHEVDTPLLVPGRQKSHIENFGNPVRIINSFLRGQQRCFKDTELLCNRDPDDLRPRKIRQNRKGRKFRTLFTTQIQLFRCKPEEQIHITSFDSSVLFKSNPKWTTNDVYTDNNASDNSDAEINAQGLDCDSDETFIYHNDGTSDKSATETDSESPCLADVELSASTDTEMDCSLPPEDSEIVHDVSVTFTEIETVTKSVKINREMDIISIRKLL